jgi:hypothetical protein
LFYLQTPRNAACHNLCTRLTPPPNLRALLGLGLSFCPRPTKTSGIRAHVTDRIRRDAHLKAFFAHTKERTDYNPKLHISSEWEAPEALIPDVLKTRLENFFVNLKATFRKRHVNPNLLFFQRQILNDLRDLRDLLIVMSDKNLGPAVIERDVYTKRVLNNHLLKIDTYRRIQPDEATQILTTLKMKVSQFTQSFSHILPINEKEYLLRSIKQYLKIPKFYLTMKIHKTPMATRPIVAVRGSITAGLGCWLDQQLQPICKKLPTYLKSSFELTDLLKDLPDLPDGARLFTAGTVSMYTNINTYHALSVIRRYLPLTPHNKAIMTALDIIMKHNFF